MPVQGQSPGEELARRGCQNLADRYGRAGENPDRPDGSIGRRLDLVGNPLRLDHEQNVALLPRLTGFALVEVPAVMVTPSFDMRRSPVAPIGL